jgi:polyhydroxyalkanoate synthesis regulator phasin
MEFDPIKLAGSKSKGGRPYFFDDPAVERLLNITMALAGELAVMRERMDTIERLLASKGVLSPAEIEHYVPDDAAAQARQQWHAEYIARVLRIVQQEMEALQNPELNQDVADIAEDLANM